MECWVISKMELGIKNGPSRNPAQHCGYILKKLCCFAAQVRNLCYMVSRREKLKLLQSKAQEQMFNLHVTLINQELSAGESFISPPVRISRLRAKS